MSTFRARAGVAQRTHCVICGTPRQAHDWTTLTCPTAYRPDTLEVAQRELAQAEASGEQHRIFVARGDVQRLGGGVSTQVRRVRPVATLGIPCDAPDYKRRP